MHHTGAPYFIKENLLDLKSHIDSNTVKVGDFNIPLSPKDRSDYQTLNGEILELNDTINQMDLIEHSTQVPKDELSSHQPMEVPPKLATY